MAFEDGPIIGRWSPSQLAARIARRPRSTMNAASAIADAAATLLSDLDCAPSFIAPLLAKLRAGADIVRIAHQPNLFPYEQLHAQTVYLVELASALDALGRPTVPIVFVVDHDSCSDDWICAARAFDPRKTHDQRRFFRHQVKGAENVVTFRRPAPSPVDRARMINEMKGLAAAFGTSPDHLIAHSGVERPAESLSHFNLFAWTNLAINVWGLPILFVRLSDVAPAFEAPRRQLAEDIGALLGRSAESLLWQLCAHCGARKRHGETCDGHRGFEDWTIPKFEVDHLSDYAIFGVSGGTAYRGQNTLTHLQAAHANGVRLGLDLAPEACWKIEADHPRAIAQANRARAGENDARVMLGTGRNSLLEHILNADRAARFLDDMHAAMRHATAA